MKRCDTESRPTRLIILRNPCNKFFAYLTKILLLLISVPAFTAELPYCSEFFRNGLQTHASDSFIRFDFNAQLLNASSRLLWTPQVINNFSSRKRSCSDQFCAHNGTPVNGLIIPYRDTYSTDALVIPAKSSVTLGRDNRTGFGTVDVKEKALVTFAPQPKPYLIDRLHLGFKSTLRLPAGEYWVGQFNLAEHGNIEVIGEGTVTLYVVDPLWIPYKFSVNGNTKNPARLGIYTFSDSNYYTGSKTYAFIRTEGEVILNHKASIFGGVLGKYVTLESESKVVFAPEALQQFTFGGLCSGAAPLRDEIPPIIDIDYSSFPNPTSADQITIRGKITDPGNDSRWIEGITVHNGETTMPVTLTGNEFSVQLPLSPYNSYFTFSAVDKAHNVSYKSISILRPEITDYPFRFEESPPSPLLTPNLLMQGVIFAPANETIASAHVTTAEGDIPLELFGNKFNVQLPIVRGVNAFTFHATTHSGMELAQEEYLEGSSEIEFQRIFIYGAGDQPERVVSGRIHSLWPAEDLQLTIEDIPATLIPESPGVYRFEQHVNLLVGRNRLDFVVTAPDGEIYATDVDDWYEPDRIFLSVNTPEMYSVVDTETVTVAGDIHLLPDYLGKNIRMVVTNDRLPGIEYPLTWLSAPNTSMEFSGEVPLALGENNLLVKLKKGKKDVSVEVGISQMEISVTRTEP